MSNVSVNGIIISSMPIGEYDRRVEILTSDYGRISAFASGARKPSSELVAASRVFALGTFELYQGKSSYNMRHAKISEFFTELSSSMELSGYGFYFLELSRYFSRENVNASDMLNLLYYSLKALIKDSIDNRLVRAVFELKMLAINGLCPDPDRIIKPDGRFSIGRELNASCAYTINYVLASEASSLYKFRLSDEVLEEFREVTSHLMKMTVDREFKSLDFLDV